MKVLTIDDLIRQSRLQNPSSDEQQYLEEIGTTAEEMVEKAINQSWEEVYEQYGEYPTSLRHAALMLADYYYRVRGEDVALPRAAAVLCRPYVKLRKRERNGL